MLDPGWQASLRAREKDVNADSITSQEEGVAPAVRQAGASHPS